MRYILLVCLLWNWASLHAEIRVIPERQYFDIVHRLIAGAESSIEVEMYLAYNDNSQVKELLDEIVEAKERGVKVNILFEDGQEENKVTLEYLKDKGVVAEFDGPDTKLHAKMILVDDKKLIIGSSNWTKSAFLNNNESNVVVDLEEDKDKIEILRTDYIDRLLEAIDSAQKEIDIVIFSFQFDYNEKSKNYELMRALLKAHDRGVRIKIVVDSWKEGQSANEPAYEVLKQSGVDVYYDLDTVASHNKLVVIDNEIVFLGSANWTMTGLTKNREASILIRDPPISRIYKAYIDELIDSLPERSELKVPIPVSFFKEGGLFRRLYLKGGTVRMRLYTWLIWEAFNQRAFTLERDYKKWYEAIYGEPALPWSRSKSDRIATLFERLEKQGVIRREDSGMKITLLDLAKGDEGKDCFYVSQEFWTLGWIRKLTGPGVYFYFINLAQFKKSPYKPVWISSYWRICREYGIGQRSLTKAIKELMAYNLIEVKHDIPDPCQPFDKRRANRYFINPLWSGEALELKWKRLAERHGVDLVFKARDLAKRINEPYDPKVVSSFIGFLKAYGEEVVTEVVDKVTRLSFENGKWEMRYIVGILQRDYSPLQ